MADSKNQEPRQRGAADRQAATAAAAGGSSKTVTTTTTVRTLTTKSELSLGQPTRVARGGSGQQQEQQVGETETVALVEDLGKQAHSSFEPASGGERAGQAAARKSGGTNGPDSGEQTGGEEKQAEGNKLVTTICTIAAQSGQSRIVLALLKDGLALRLKVQEMGPGIFEVGENYRECSRYLEEQERLVANLRKQKRAPIEAWMAKYKEICALEPEMSTERRLVFACMAESLQACWGSLLDQLDERSQLLRGVCKFYDLAEQLGRALDEADQHVQQFRHHFLEGPSSAKFDQVCQQLEALNRVALDRYEFARASQRKLIELIGIIGTGNLGDSRVNLIIPEARGLISFISAYLDPFERRRLQLESVITTSTSISHSSQRTSNSSEQTHWRSQQQQQQQQHQGGEQASNKYTSIREIQDFNDLDLVRNWLELKIEQLNSSLLSSLGVCISDSRTILSKHEQIALECRAIEEATLTFKGKNIHAIKTLEQAVGVKESAANGKRSKSLFEEQKFLAVKARDVITILEARIVLLRRTIDFYSRALEATTDLTKLMRRLQVEDSLQSIQFVANELEAKDVSSVVASGATIISELQQLQLAQQHGQRSRIVNLSLVTSGIRSVIDQLNQDLAHLKSVLNQRKLVLLNEDATKMANNFTNKCNQLSFWLKNNVKSFLLSNNRIESGEAAEVRKFCESHEQVRTLLQTKTLEVEALLRSLPTLIEHFEPESRRAEEIERLTDELRADWIELTNCLDQRAQLAQRYAAICATIGGLEAELDLLDKFKSGAPMGGEQTDEDICANIDGQLAQLAKQVDAFSLEAEQAKTRVDSNEVNKEQLVGAAKAALLDLGKRRRAYGQTVSQSEGQPAHQRPQQADPPRFTRVLVDCEAEPFSSVNLECEVQGDEYQLEWLMNNFKKIPAQIKHSIWSENNRHRLTISNFSPICCGTYIARASNKAGQAVSQCRLRLLGIRETREEAHQWRDEAKEEGGQLAGAARRRGAPPQPQPSFLISSPAASTASSFSQWRPASGDGDHNNNNNNNSIQVTSERSTEREGIARIIQSAEQPPDSGPRPQPSSSGERARGTETETETQTTTTRITQTTTSRERLPVAQSGHSGPGGGGRGARVGAGSASSANSSNQPRVSCFESPLSSQTLSRSVSKSPFEGSPQAPVFLQTLTDSMPHCHSRAGLVCLVVGNPPPTIEWLHNNTTIATTKCPRGAQSCQQRANLCKLTIETMNNKTQGHYLCRASNRIGQTATGLTLTK